MVARSSRRDEISDQVGALRTASEQLLRRHGRDVRSKQHQQKRLAHAAMDITAQIAQVAYRRGGSGFELYPSR